MAAEKADVLARTVFTPGYDRKWLFSKIKHTFPDYHPIWNFDDFSYNPLDFRVGDRNVELNFLPDEAQQRIDLIVGVMNLAATRVLIGNEKYPELNPGETMEAYSVILANWLSVHGALGGDGNGRAAASLYGILLDVSGHLLSLGSKTDFFDEQGVYNANRMKVTLLYSSGYVFPAIRNLASYLSVQKNGKTPDLLRERNSIFEGDFRRRARAKSMSVLLRKY